MMFTTKRGGVRRLMVITRSASCLRDGTYQLVEYVLFQKKDFDQRRSIFNSAYAPLLHRLSVDAIVNLCVAPRVKFDAPE